LKSFPLPGALPQYGPDKVVDVEHIDLYLTPELAAQRMEGVCTTTVRAIDDGVHDLRLDAVDFVIGWVRDESGRRLDFRRDAGTLTVHLARPLAAGERTQFAVAYRLEKPRVGLHFVAPTKDHPDKPTQCWTQSQDEYARYWFPCFDYPHAKQPTSTTIVVPTGTFALGNGRLVERSDDSATGYTTFRYVQDAAHSTYLVTMVAGSFAEIEQKGASVPVFYYVPPGREADGERSFGKTPEMLTFFEQRTGMPYPYARYSQIAVADFIFGGMENTTATTQTDRTLHDERAHLDFSSDPLVAHELAHQWFGDLLTTRDWSHAWLNEGFATFFETLFREHDLGRDEYLYAMYEHVKTYLRETRERYARAIVENRFHFPIEVFDRHLYEKGGAVLHMLRGLLGEERFWKSVRHYVRENAGRSVETIDLIRAIEAATGRNLRAFFDQWVFRAGHPELRVTYAYEHAARTATLRVEQRQPFDDANPPYRFDLDVGFLEAQPAAIERDAGPGPLAFERRHRVAVEHADQTFTFACDAAPALVRVDPNATVLGTLEFAFGVPMLAAVLAADPSPVARVRAALALAKDASAPALTALGTALTDEPFWAVRAETARALAETRLGRAKELLLAACDEQHPKARRAVAEGLGNFRSQDAADALLLLAREDVSYFVVETALEALGKTRDRRAFDALREALERPSWSDKVANGAARGLSELADPRAVALIIAATERRRSDSLRAEATRALGRAATVDDAARPAAVERLIELFGDDSFMVRRAAIQTAGTLGDRRLLPALERIVDAPADGRLRRAATEAASAVRGGLGSSARLSELESEVEALRAECRGLRERLGVNGPV
jgi:aminopeptidase N